MTLLKLYNFAKKALYFCTNIRPWICQGAIVPGKDYGQLGGGITVVILTVTGVQEPQTPHDPRLYHPVTQCNISRPWSRTWSRNRA